MRVCGRRSSDRQADQGARPVANAPFVTSRWTHSQGDEGDGEVEGRPLLRLRRFGTECCPTGSFSIPCVGNATATVLGEKRRIPVREEDRSADSFADGNAVPHLPHRRRLGLRSEATVSTAAGP